MLLFTANRQAGWHKRWQEGINAVAEVLEEPEEIRVTANIEGVPVSLSRKGKREKITAIYGWWRMETKIYFRVKTKGFIYDIYHAVGDKRWYLAKIHD